MTARVVFLFASVTAFAQLPPAQAPPPRVITESRKAEPPARTIARVDATVSDMKGNPITGLTAADFTLEVNGKQESIETCVYRADQPLRLAVIVDDLSLSAPHLDKARQALGQFVAVRLRPGDEAAILRTSAGAGALDRLTPDHEALSAAIARVTYNPASESAADGAFTAGTLGALRAVVEGMRELPGRKALLLISDRLRTPARENVAVTTRITTLAHQASAVVFAVDMRDAPEQPFMLEQGLAAAARETGGVFVDGGDIAKILDRIAQQQAGYYVLGYHADGDFLTGAPRVSQVAVKAKDPDALVRARNGVFGATNSLDDQSYRNPEHEFERAVGQELVSGDVRIKLTGLVTIGNSFVVDGLVHVDGRDLTFRKGLDGRYYSVLETAVALYGEDGVSVKEVARTIEVMLGEESFRTLRASGVDYTLSLALTKPGCYQLRALTRDAATGRMGSAREFMRATNWSQGNLVMSSIVLRGESRKREDGAETPKNPDESTALRIFTAGRQLTYTYSLFNAAADAQRRSTVEVKAQIFRNGVLIHDGDAVTLAFNPAADPGRRAATGVIKLGEQAAPGHYILRLRVTDKIAPHTATQQMDFEVRP